MSGKNINFDDKIIKKGNFYKSKELSRVDDIDINKKLIPKKVPYGPKNSPKYFISCFHTEMKFMPRCKLFLKNNVRM